MSIIHCVHNKIKGYGHLHTAPNHNANYREKLLCESTCRRRNRNIKMAPPNFNFTEEERTGKVKTYCAENSKLIMGFA